MFGTPGVDIFSSWISIILLFALFIIGIVIWKFISSVVENHFNNNPNSKSKWNKFIDKLYELPRPIKMVFRVISTVVYIVLCIVVIAYAS